jgi:hypothetical protein
LRGQQTATNHTGRLLTRLTTLPPCVDSRWQAEFSGCNGSRKLIFGRWGTQLRLELLVSGHLAGGSSWNCTDKSSHKHPFAPPAPHLCVHETNHDITDVIQAFSAGTLTLRQLQVCARLAFLTCFQFTS